MATKPMPASEPTIEEATAEAEEAAALVDALQERIRSGDDSVTAVDLANARSLADFASLQRDAAERRAQQVNVQLITNEVAAVVAAARALATARFPEHERLREAAQQAFSSYKDSVDGMSYAASQILSRLRAINVRATAAGVATTAASSVREASGQLEVRIEDGTHVFPPDRPNGYRPVIDVAEAAALGPKLEYGGGLSLNRKRSWPPEG
jgi:hypothetical protein